MKNIHDCGLRSPPPRAAKILIVEDDPTLLRGLKDNFLACGYQVRTAPNGHKGLDDLLRDPPDVALLDVILPRVNGFEICCAARSNGLTTPIILLSCRDAREDVAHGFELGADEYVTKPFDVRRLIERADSLRRRAP